MAAQIPAFAAAPGMPHTTLEASSWAITLPPAEAEAYLANVTSAIPAVLAKDAQMKLDYETMMAAGKKYR